MEKIILEIREALEKQGLSETKLAKIAGLGQVKVNRLLNGTTKRLDLGMVRQLQEALGIVAEASPVYGGTQVIEGLSQEEAEMIRIIRESPEAAAVVKMMGAVDGDTKTDIQHGAEKEKRMYDIMQELKNKKRE